MPLGIWREMFFYGKNRLLMMYGCERILQGLAFPHMHMYMTCRHKRQIKRGRYAFKPGPVRLIHAIARLLKR